MVFVGSYILKYQKKVIYRNKKQGRTL